MVLRELGFQVISGGKRGIAAELEAAKNLQRVLRRLVVKCVPNCKQDHTSIEDWGSM